MGCRNDGRAVKYPSNVKERIGDAITQVAGLGPKRNNRNLAVGVLNKQLQSPSTLCEATIPDLY